MASSRIGSDADRMERKQDTSSGTLNYMINVPGNGATPDFIADPHIRLQKFGANISTNIVDINSNLKGIDTQLSKEGPVPDTRDPTFNDRYMKYVYPSITDAVTDEPRSMMPAWQVRDLEQNHWDYLPKNPQAHTEIEFDNNINSRRLDKDAYDKVCRDTAYRNS